METTTRTHRIKCGRCGWAHGDAATVKDCYENYDNYEAEARAEMAAEAEAEARYERWLEEGGPHREQIAYENDLDMRRALY